jgi:hypothetical protein
MVKIDSQHALGDTIMIERILRLVGLASLLAVAPTGSQAAELFLGTSAVTGIMESYPSNNMGAVGWFPAGAIQNVACGTITNPYPCLNRGLIKFDLASYLPAGSVIKDVRMRIWVTVQPPNDETDYNTLFNLHRLLVPWGEGTGTNTALFPGQVGRPALAGESSWLMRQAPSNSWAVPGGAAGVDYTNEASATVYVSMEPGSQSDFPVLGVSNLLIRDFQLWLDQPAQNFGLLLKAADENARWTAKRFMTPESGVDEYPRVEITYIPPPEILNLQTNVNGVSFEFTAEAGQDYTVQFRDTLETGGWNVFTNVPAPPDTTGILILDSGAITNAQRFYRVVAPQ